MSGGLSLSPRCLYPAHPQVGSRSVDALSTPLTCARSLSPGRLYRLPESLDPVTDGLIQRFTAMEEHVSRFNKDATAFRDAVNSLLSSSTDFAHAFTTIFSPIGGESSYEFESKFPNAKMTIQNIGEYEASFDELKETIRPEIELIESRVLAPVKELQEFVKKVRKTITKRDHKVGLLLSILSTFCKKRGMEMLKA